MEYEHNELRHRALLARFMTVVFQTGLQGLTTVMRCQICVCVCVLNKINAQSVNIFCTSVSFPSLPLPLLWLRESRYQPTGPPTCHRFTGDTR